MPGDIFLEELHAPLPGYAAMVPKQSLEPLVQALYGGIRVGDVQGWMMVASPQERQIKPEGFVGGPWPGMGEVRPAVGTDALFRKEAPPFFMP